MGADEGVVAKLAYLSTQTMTVCAAICPVQTNECVQSQLACVATSISTDHQSVILHCKFG
jgi:hypothetical protein